MPSQIAAQMYTLREFTKTPADIASTLKKVKKLGYDAVQLSALGPIDAKELATILKNEGLTCVATHISTQRLEAGETPKIIDDLKTWGAKYTAIGGYWPKENNNEPTWRKFIADYNGYAKQFAAAGCRLGYHNHHHELSLLNPGGERLTPMDLMIGGMDPSVWFEIDVYWITAGGGDPIDYIRRVKGRIPCVHLKDMGVKYDKTQYMMEVGEGNLNMPGIIAACREAGTEWFIVEQDVCYRDPFESLAISLRHCREMGLS